MDHSCLFCQIANGEKPAFVFWENTDFMAFLSIYPNIIGFSVVIPRLHKTSYVFDQSAQDISGIMEASRAASLILQSRMSDVSRVGVMFEGFGVDHLHTKLFPMVGTGEMSQWSPIRSQVRHVFEKYEGYMSSHDGPQADSTSLQWLRDQLIRGT